MKRSSSCLQDCGLRCDIWHYGRHFATMRGYMDSSFKMNEKVLKEPKSSYTIESPQKHSGSSGDLVR